MSAFEDTSVKHSGLFTSASAEQSDDQRHEQTPGVRRITTEPIDEDARKINDGEERPLESHEVIELQAFSERKVWIEEKIKLLEQMPPIEVFIGLDAIRDSALEVPGLPNRAALQEWVAEHDRIEKETEIFDSGELKKLKKFTKAAAQRNLSPADTDLIELTLTTIYELDKLLHLLRDRSDHLELLGVRLTWEERRIGAWIELQSTLADVSNFLRTRAQWAPTVYDELDFINKEDETPPLQPVMTRRNSVVSITSIASDTSISSTNFSRGARFKLSEQLSRDAAQFSSRVSSLRHSRINAAGKALDKLIDDSRKPVPEVLLDEQDRLEDKGIKEMEDVGKFVMSVVMQWKKADELYVETAKDKVTAQALLEEIETAKLSHPNPRQDAAYLSRTNALTKRLAMRGNPAISSSNFPRPIHPLFPDQQKANDTMVLLLSAEYVTATEVTKRGEALARQYHAGLDAVRKVESARKTALELLDQLTVTINRLQEGVGDSNGDPPDLSTEACLSPTQHSVFLALLPTHLQELQQVENAVEDLLASVTLAIADLDRPGIDVQFIAESAAEFERLKTHCQDAKRISELVVSRAAALSDVRQIWSKMEVVFKDLNQIRYDAVEAVEKDVWKQQSGQNNALLTPESPASPLPPRIISVPDMVTQVETTEARFGQEMSSFMENQARSLGTSLRHHLLQCKEGLSDLVTGTKDLLLFLEAIRKQAAVMRLIQEETNELQVSLENQMIRFEGASRDVLKGDLQGEQLVSLEGDLSQKLAQLTHEIQSFSESLVHRIPFVYDGKSIAARLIPNRKRPRMALGFSLDVVLQEVSIGSPVDPSDVDRAVRADANAFSVSLSGALESLSQRAEHFRLSQVSRALDVVVASVVTSLQRIEATLASITDEVDRDGDETTSLGFLTRSSGDAEQLSVNQILPLAASIESIQQLLRELDNSPTTTQSSLISSRRRAVENTEQRYAACKTNLGSLVRRIEDARSVQKLRIAEEHRAAEEKTAQVCAATDIAAGQIDGEEADGSRQEGMRFEKEETADATRLEGEVDGPGRIASEESAEISGVSLNEDTATKQHPEDQAMEAVQAGVVEAEAEIVLLKEKETSNNHGEPIDSQGRNASTANEQEQMSRPTELLDIVEEIPSGGMDPQPSSEVRPTYSNDGPVPLQDVFGMRSVSAGSSSNGSADLKNGIFVLRKRLHSIGINEIVRPMARSSHSLPTQTQQTHVEKQLALVVQESERLRASSFGDKIVNVELRSLHSEIQASQDLLSRMQHLASFSASVEKCDNTLSDLLEHIDSYPSLPSGLLSLSHSSDPSQSPQDQLAARLMFTEVLISKLSSQFKLVADDPRANAEHDRALQTWSELQAMGMDKVQERKSRPGSVLSSGESSTSRPASVASLQVRKHKKAHGYTNLSIGSPGQFLSPPLPSTRRSASGGTPRPRGSGLHAQPSNRPPAMSNNRSVSGPGPAETPSRLHNSTFASRQRNSSISSTTSASVTPVKVDRIVPINSRARAQTAQPSRTASPAFSETSSMHSRSSLNLSRTSMRSTWARAPRQSFPSLPRSPPRSQTAAVRRPYIANPTNKLDVAVGDVVNKLPSNVHINVEVVADTWKDQSGKYWIGDQDPKLCFCRILRSQTVMVRVGGGWSELSKFIRDHVADAFRLLPESPPRFGSRDEKWINSSTLSQVSMQLPEPPRTPEPQHAYIPSFALSTPSGTSPRSIKTSSPGSPLTALQFIRRADRESPLLRPETPTRTSRSGVATPSTSARAPVWRP